MSRATSWAVRSAWYDGRRSLTHFESDTREAIARSGIEVANSSMAMAKDAHVSFRPFRDELSRMGDGDTVTTIDKGEFRRKNSETGSRTQWWLAGCFPSNSDSVGRSSQPSQFPDDGTMIQMGTREAQNEVRRVPLGCDGATRGCRPRTIGASLASPSRRAAQQTKGEFSAGSTNVMKGQGAG